MKIQMSSAIAVLALGALATARAEETSPAEALTKKIVAVADEDNQVMEHLDHLVNKIGPRLTASTRIEKAYEWTAEQFKKFGLENVRVETWGEWAVGFDRGPWSGKLLAPNEEPRKLTCGTMAWTAGTNGPVRGPAIWEPRTKEELSKVGDKIKGSWLVRRPGRTRVDRAEREAVTKAINDLLPAGRVLGLESELIVTDGNPRGIDMNKLPTRVTVMIVKSDFKVLRALLDEEKPCDLEFDIKNTFVAGPRQNKNVIAEIRGSEKPDEIVIVGGHLDSWDGATGTTDNGTGVATTLEAARLLAKSGVKPLRTIRFMLWSGEEQGLLGSRAWIKNHPEELKKISCVLVHDGGTNVVSGIGLTSAQMAVAEPSLAHLRTLSKEFPFRLHAVKSLPFGVGSDHDSFLAAGVPGYFWEQTGKQNYEHEHHTQHDLYSAAIPEYQKHSAVMIASASLAFANLDRLLPREGMLAPRGEGQARKMLGVQTTEDVTISSVVEGSLAEKAGLQEGDRILSVGGKVVTTTPELRAAIQASEGDTEIRYLREGKELTVTVKFSSPTGKRRWM